MPRTCEENLARRAWASAYHRQRQLEHLLTQPTIRKVYARSAREALDKGEPRAIAAALAEVEAEVGRCQEIAQRLAA
jgi:hypothetical protein